MNNRQEEINTLLQLIMAIRLGGDPKDCHLSIANEENLLNSLYNIVEELIEVERRDAVTAFKNASDQSNRES